MAFTLLKLLDLHAFVVQCKILHVNTGADIGPLKGMTGTGISTSWTEATAYNAAR